MSTTNSKNEPKLSFNNNDTDNILESFLNYNPQKHPLITQKIPYFDYSFKFLNLECPVCLSQIKGFF